MTLKSLFSLFLLFLFFVTVPAQNVKKYQKLTTKAFELYEAGQYLPSAQTYTKAFIALGNKGFLNDRYNAACSWALAGNVDSAFWQLFRISRKGDYVEYDHLTTDTDLASLHADPRWEEVKALVKAAKEQAEKNLDRPLVAQLDSIHTLDQAKRIQQRAIREQHGPDSPEYKALWQEIRLQDSLNLIAITHILDTRGWLGPDVVGARGNSTLFLVIQHSNLAVQEKYLPMMREAVKAKKAYPADLALLEDRVALGQGKRQTYGSQIYTDPETKAYYVAPLDDPLHVDERRAAMGLPPMASYLTNWNLKWDAKKYLKELPAIEAKNKK